MNNNQAGIVGKKANTTIKTLGTEKTKVKYREGPDRALKEEITPKIKAPEVTIKKEGDTLEAKS
jgi:intein/homing endonuclease